MAENSGVEVSKAVLSIIPVMGSIGKSVDTELRKSTGTVAKAGSSIGLSLGKAITSGASKGAEDLKDLERQIEAQANRTAKAVAAAKQKQEDAARKAAIAEKQYSEAVAKSGKDSARALAAEDRMIRAKRDAASATTSLTRATKVQEAEQADATKKLDSAAKSYKSFGSRIKSGLASGAAAIKSFGHNADNAASKAGKDAGHSFGGGFKDTVKGVFTGGALLGVASSVGNALTGQVSQAITQSDATDKFKATLKFAGQSTKQIGKLTKSAQAYADKTVYNLDDIQSATAQLTANGIKNADGLVKSLGNLNAVAGGNADTFKSVAMVETQTAGAGKLTTENWNQLANAIPGASGILQKQMKKNGAYVGNFRDAMAQGKITSDEFNKAIQQTGGTKAAARAATSTKTIEGAWGNLQAGITGGLAKIVTALKPFITLAINGLSQVVSVASTYVMPVVKRLTDGLSGKGGGLGSAFKQISAVLLPVASALLSLGKRLLPVIISAVKMFYAQVQKNMPAIKKLFQQVAPVVKQLGDTILPIAKVILPILAKVFGTTLKAVIGILSGAVKVISGILNVLHGVFTGNSKEIKKGVTQIFSGMGKILVSTLKGVVGILGDVWGGIAQLFAKPVNWVIDNVINKLIDAINWVAGKLGLSIKVSHVSEISNGSKSHGGGATGSRSNTGPVRAFADGGRVKAKSAYESGGTDRIGAMLDRDEHVTKRKSVKSLDKALPGGLDYINRTGKWPVGPLAETAGVNQQAKPGPGVPVALKAALPTDLAEVIKRGPQKGDKGGYGAVNPLSYATSQLGHSGWYNRCLAFVNAAWNYSVGRFRLATARASMNAGPRSMAGIPTAGAAVYWDTGPAGHVALAAGDGTVFSNDIITPGVISRVPQTMINRWGPYEGWWSPTGAQGTAGSLPGGSSALGAVAKWAKSKIVNTIAGKLPKIPGGGALADLLKGVTSKLVGGAASKLFGKQSGGLNAYAKGTKNAKRGLAVVGEAGPEVVNFNGGESVTSNKDLTAAVSKVFTANNKQLKSNLLAQLNAQIDGFQDRLKKLKKGTPAYKAVTAQLADAQNKLKAANKIDTSQGVAAATAKFVKRYASSTKKLATIARQRASVAAQIKTANAAVTKAQTAVTNAKTARADYVSGVKDTVTSYGALDTGQASTSLLMASMRQKVTNAKKFLANLKLLKKRGLNGSMLQQLIAAGPDGGLAASNEILSGGGSGIRNLNAIQSQITSLASQTATFGAEANGDTAAVTAANKALSNAKSRVSKLNSQDARLAKQASRTSAAITSSAKSRLAKSVVPASKAVKAAQASQKSGDVYAYIENPFTGDVLLQKMRTVSNEQIKRTAKAARTARNK